ncbi:hypothetical protein J4442_03430 [Candidatus Woesearchaeota archaeon]|nr:hypothetical protein [Candidatus Woesearchaeota archaeon]
MAKKKMDVVENNDSRVFKSNKQALLTIAVVVLLALVAFNFEGITGNAVTGPTSLSVFQDGNKVTVQVNYPAGKYGRENNLINMNTVVGTKRADEYTKCDTDRGYVARGNSKCLREIATFDISGTTWKTGELVRFSVKNTDVSRDYRLQ